MGRARRRGDLVCGCRLRPNLFRCIFLVSEAEVAVVIFHIRQDTVALRTPESLPAAVTLRSVLTARRTVVSGGTALLLGRRARARARRPRPPGGGPPPPAAPKKIPPPLFPSPPAGPAPLFSGESARDY